MVLRLWLEQSGYSVREVLSDPIQTADLDVLFVLDPFVPYRSEEAAQIREWVQRGHTLIVAARPYSESELLGPLGASISFLDRSVDVLAPTSLVLLFPPFDRVRVDTLYGVDTRRPDALVHLAAVGAPVLVCPVGLTRCPQAWERAPLPRVFIRVSPGRGRLGGSQQFHAAPDRSFTVVGSSDRPDPRDCVGRHTSADRTEVPVTARPASTRRQGRFTR